MDKLSQLIEERVKTNKWRLMKVGRRRPMISHLFVDDLLVFAEAKEEKIKIVMEVMTGFCSVSELKVNSAKTTMVFSKNINLMDRKTISKISQFKKNKVVFGCCLNLIETCI
ncbi:hypothetical protein AHAS_Ahas16G0232300 [Arachis hypogaea]